MYRIIVLDDEPNLVEGLCDSLERELGGNIEVFKAYSGQELCSLLTSMRAVMAAIQNYGRY